MKKIYLLISCFLLVFQITEAQNSKTATPTHKLLKSYINSVNALEKEGNTKKVLDLYSDRYSGNTTYVNLSGGIIKKAYVKEDIKKQLDDIIQDNEYSFSLKLNKILYGNQKDNAGTISALLDFESYIDKKVAEKGTMLINMVAVSQNNKWRIIQNNMVRVSEAKDIGDCVCYIYAKGDTKFVTELYYPAGVTYDHKFESFQFTSNGSGRVIKSLGENFVWETGNNKILLEKKEIGSAKTQREAIEILIKRKNQEPCANIIFR